MQKEYGKEYFFLLDFMYYYSKTEGERERDKGYFLSLSFPFLKSQVSTTIPLVKLSSVNGGLFGFFSVLVAAEIQLIVAGVFSCSSRDKAGD